MVGILKTKQQRAIMDIVFDQADKGILLSCGEIHQYLESRDDILPQAVLMSLNVLEKHGMIRKVREGRYKLVTPTDLAYSTFR